MPRYTVDLAPQANPDLPPLEGEWLITNGIGSFAMGTAIGCNTRRYHSLLVASQNPPVERINTLAAMGEALVFDGDPVELNNHEFATDDGTTVFHPAGWRYLTHFHKDTACHWTYQVGPILLHKMLRLIWQRNVGVLTYRIEVAEGGGALPSSLVLTLTPFVALRDFHHLRASADPCWFSTETHARSFTVAAADLPTLRIAASRGHAAGPASEWRNFRYQIETARGQDDTEALLVPGSITCDFTDPQRLTKAERLLTVTFGTEATDWSLVEREDTRTPHLDRIIRNTTRDVNDTAAAEHLTKLALAGDDFVVRRSIGDRKLSTILAGYPWFADWGRDTMISLPGLLLCTGRFEEAGRTLTAYAENIRDGLIPNRFDDYGGEPHYNTVDASLWFVHAAMEYVRTSGDTALWDQLLHRACCQIVDAYRDGVPPEIGMHEDGLIWAGSEHTQLTWMDAKRDGVVFTPRHGKAVEINALWYRALCGLAEAKDGKPYADLTKLVKKSFVKTFWSDDLGYLIDHVNEHGVDESLRPNQVFAVSLPHSPLPRTKQKQVMKAMRDQLLTPMGLRTLPVTDPNYHPQCAGSMFQRDEAYHQGTVWAWPIGAYVEGYLRAHQFSAAARKHALKALAPLLDEMHTHSLGQLHEVFDGDAPHTPRGCMAQAWSVAEVLRAVALIERGG